MFQLNAVGNLPLHSTFFSAAADAKHQIPQAIDIRYLVLPLDTTFPSSVHCREAANTSRRLLCMAHQSFTELSKAAFILLYRVIVRPHPGYAIRPGTESRHKQTGEDPTPCNMASERKGFAHSTSSRWNIDASKLAFKIPKGEADLNPFDFLLRPPRAAQKGHAYRLLQ